MLIRGEQMSEISYNKVIAIREFTTCGATLMLSHLIPQPYRSPSMDHTFENVSGLQTSTTSHNRVISV